MRGQTRRRVVIWAYILNSELWFYIALIRSIKCGCISWPIQSQTGWIVFILFTLLFAISVWELNEEDD